MTKQTQKCATIALQWVLGLVVLIEACFLAFSPPQIQAFHKTHLPDFIRLVLSWGEIVGAALFLIPRALRLGGWILIAVFTAAAAVHLLHGLLDIGMLLICAAATRVVVVHRMEQP
jgi:hypothetical protein